MIDTLDFTTKIVAVVGDRIEYENTDGRKWWVSGYCNQCGMCEDWSDATPLNTPIKSVHIRKNEQGTSTFERVLVWKSAPGSPGACEELGYNIRADIPMTPAAIAKSQFCTYRAGWIN
jgi:hypothetical protein